MGEEMDEGREGKKEERRVILKVGKKGKVLGRDKYWIERREGNDEKDGRRMRCNDRKLKGRIDWKIWNRLRKDIGNK